MQDLMRESRGDFKSFLRMEPEMFRDMLDRVAPRIEKSQEGRPPQWQGLNLAIKPMSHCHGLDAGRVTFLIRDYSS